MRSFTVLPKKGLEPFTIKMDRFEVEGSVINLFDEHSEAAKDAFLSFDDVAAILPEEKQKDIEG